MANTKETDQSKLNEELGNPLSASNQASVTGSKYPYFSYELLSFNHKCEQPGNSSKIKRGNHLVIGDLVKGLSPYDNRYHKGAIQRFWRKDDDPANTLIYILDNSAQVIPVYAKTAKRLLDRSTFAKGDRTTNIGGFPPLF